jgi:hypothetical protein
VRALTASDVLELWSAGRGDGALTRGLALLAAAADAGTPAELAELPLGELNRRVLELRARTLDRPLECRTACPRCGEQLEAEIEPRGLARDEPPPRRRETLLELRCAACGEAWTEPLDVVSFFVAELDVVARNLLAEVHLLARAYGWREADALALPARRRAAYLELIAREGAA